jgi:hypothetical protein
MFASKLHWRTATRWPDALTVVRFMREHRYTATTFLAAWTLRLSEVISDSSAGVGGYYDTGAARDPQIAAGLQLFRQLVGLLTPDLCPGL